MSETKRQIHSKLVGALVRPLKTIFGRVFARREYHLDTVLSNISQGVCMFDSYQRLVFCNERYLQMYKLSAEVVRPGCTLRELLDHRQAVGLLHDDPEEYYRTIEEHNSQEKTLALVTELADGRCIEMIHQPLPGGGWVVTHEDITERRRALEEARQAHARLRDAIDILPHGLVFLDADGKYILWNQQYADIYKRSADLFKPGVRLEDTLRIGVARGDYPEAVGREEEWIAERLSKLYNPRGRHEQNLSDGRCILIEERRTSEGGIIGLRVDITEMKRREESFKLLFDGNPVPMFIYALEDQRMLAVNDTAVEHYGYRRESLLAMTLQDIHEDTSDATVPCSDLSQDEAGKTWKHHKADGTVIDVAIFSRRLIYQDRAAALIAAVDITERKRAEARIAFMAHHDALTLLPNRVLLHSRLEEMLHRLQRDVKGFAVIYVDLDNFKAVNDTLGHPFGDRLLQNVAARLQDLLREDDIVARFGGDEFAIIQADVTQPEHASVLAQRVIDAIGEPYELAGHHISVGASVGITLAPGDSADADALLKNADMAVYRAKADGRGTFRFFEPEMDDRMQARHRLEVDLRAALQNGQLKLHYQPLVDLRTGQVTGFEALMRWPHPERDWIPPTEFIKVAEETGLIAPLGAFVIQQACIDAASWPRGVKVAVNLSPLQFRYGTLFQQVTDALRRSGLSASRLELEITETLLLEKNDQVVATLHALRALGVRISMDDFGTGYSSLSYLRSFPFDKIKIDQSFVRDLCTNEDSQAIVRAVVRLGESFGIIITAEGIENESDLQCLIEDGCNEGQGYLFSKAMPANEIIQFLTNKRKKVA
jgi:diguanylate cyclase (GGDEF)-like protein/PAS domain S-box-containing protein